MGLCDCCLGDAELDDDSLAHELVDVVVDEYDV
jgi:hypothetical protein